MSFGIPVRNGLGVGLLASTFLSSLRIGGRPAMFLNFIGTNSLDSRVTFTRGTTATFVGSNGLIQTAAIDAPRFDYDPATLAPKGLLIEEQRTNLLTYSEQFDNASWTKTAATVTANTTISPDGTMTADTLTENTANSTHRAFAVVTLAAVPHTSSIYVKAGTRSWFYIRLTGSTGAQRNAFFNVSTGVLGTVDVGLTASITPAGNGWYRCVATINDPFAGFTNIFGIADANGNITYTGNGTGSLIYWGAQLEVGAFASSYIPTVASTVVRNIDFASMTSTNFSSWYNQTQGTFLFTGDTVGNVAGKYPRPFNANDGSANNRIFQYVNSTGSQIGTQTSISGGLATAQVSNTISSNTVFKSASAYQSGSIATVLNGGTIATASNSGVPTVDRLFIGSADEPINGHVRQIAYYNTRLTNATLQVLTT